VAQSYVGREKMRPKLLLLGALVAAAVAAGVLWSRLPLSGGDAAASTAPDASLAGSSAPALGVVVVPQLGSVQRVASGDFTLTDFLQPVPGLSAALAGPVDSFLEFGVWKVEVCLLFETQGSGDEGRSAAFALRVDDVVQPGAGVTRLFANRFQTTCFAWHLDLSVTTLVEVVARKDTGATGTSKVLAGNETSRLIATEVFAPDMFP
jgi:hypothetical protein